MPSFSAIDYRGPLNNNNDLYISARNARAANNTPFVRVYGDGTNDEHINVFSERNAWSNLFQTEFNVNVGGNNTTPQNCNAQTTQAPPPLPYFTVPRLCADGSGVTTATLQIDPGLDGLFDYTWTVQPGNISVNGPSLLVSLGMLSSGAATITCTARSRQNPTVTTAFSQVVRPCPPVYVCLYQEGEFVYQNASGVSYYAHLYQGTRYTTTASGQGGQFVSRSVLLANAVPSVIAACFAETDPRGPTPPTPGSYEGNLDWADCGNIAGWVYDRNNPNAALTVEILEGSTVVATGTAADFRQDLLDAGKGNGRHGYVIPIPAALKNGQNRTLSVRVAGSTYMLNGSYQTINCPGSGGPVDPPPPPNPNADYEGHFDYSGCETVGGWVYDRNNPNTHLSVEIVTNGSSVGGGPAANFRGDLLTAGKGNGEHGFAISTPGTVKNGQNQSLTIRVAGTNYAIPNSPQTINCAGTGTPPPPPPPTGNGNYEGFFDYADCGYLAGWVYDRNSPNAHLTIELLDGSTVVTSAQAANFRQDLLNDGKGNGEHGFGFGFPASLKNGQAHSLSIRVAGSSYMLNNSPRTVTCSPGTRQGIETDVIANTLLLYPNPATDEVTASFYLAAGEKAQLVITDALGRAVQTTNLVGEGTTRQQPISLRGQPAGVFVVRLQSDRQALVGKVLLNH